VTGSNTNSRAVPWDGSRLVRTVRWRTVAKTLSIGFEVRSWSRRSEEADRAALEALLVVLDAVVPGQTRDAMALEEPVQAGSVRFGICG